MKRGNDDDISVGGDQKRKFVLIGEGWGKGDEKEDQGLNVKRGTGLLQGNTIIEDEKPSRNENHIDLGDIVKYKYKMRGTKRVKVEQVLWTILTPWGNRMVWYLQGVIRYQIRCNYQ